MRNRTVVIHLIGSAILILTLMVSGLYAQVSDRERDKILKEARDLAKGGNREAAIGAIEALYARIPHDGTVVRALAGLLIDTGNQERAETVLSRYVGLRPNDFKALSELAVLYFRMDERSEGMEIIDRIADMAPGELWPYQLSLDVFMDVGMVDEIVPFILEARQSLGDSALFAIDAAQIYRDQKIYSAAAWEYLLSSESEHVGDEISAECLLGLARVDEARPYVMKAIRHAGRIGAFKGVVHRTLWEVLLMDGACREALEELAGLVERDRAFAEFLVIFAHSASEAGCHGECSKAYAEAARYTENKAKIPAYLVEQAGCELAAGLVDDALATYDDVATRFRNTPWANKALLARARAYSSLDRLDEAIAETDKVIVSRQVDESRLDAILFKSECLILTEQVEAAFTTYDLVETDWDAPYAQEAFFNMGEVKFYQAHFDDATSYYNVVLRQYPAEARANDAIDRLLLLKGSRIGETYTPELKDYARASLLRRQGRPEHALPIFEKLAEASNREAIKVESLRSMSEIYTQARAYDDAIRTYRLIGDSLESSFSAPALEAVGDIYLRLGKTDQAIQAYEDVILKYPDSVAAGDARRKIEIAKRGTVDEP